MSLLVLTASDHQISHIADIAIPTHRAFAEWRGCDFRHITEFTAGQHPSWTKMLYVREALNTHDIVMWIDADAVITNPLKNPLASLSEGKIHLSRDWGIPERGRENCHFSCGCYVAFSCPEVKAFFDASITRKEWANKPLWDQYAMQAEYLSDERWRDVVEIHPRRVFNAVPSFHPALEPWQPTDFLCHFTCMSAEDRAAWCQVVLDRQEREMPADFDKWIHKMFTGAQHALSDEFAKMDDGLFSDMDTTQEERP